MSDFFFTEEKAVFSHRKETLEIKPRERFFAETARGEEPEAQRFDVVKISIQEHGSIVSPESLKKEMFSDFDEFASFANAPDSFLRMFEKYPALYSTDETKSTAFFMPRRHELAIAIATQKKTKDATVYFSPLGQKDFFLWRIALINGKTIVIEYASKENLFWVDEGGDGIPEFCLKEQHGNWLQFECLKETVSPNERPN